MSIIAAEVRAQPAPPMESVPICITASRQAGSFWLNIGTPHGDPVFGLTVGRGLATATVGVGDDKVSGELGSRTTRLSAVQQICDDLPFVKLSAERSDARARVAGWVDVSACHSSNWPAAPLL